MKKLPISVYMIASNEEERLPVALEAIKDWADEIIVVIDEKCTDKTKEIAESYGAVVSLKNWVGFAAQKCFAEAQCKNDWVFNLDADEEVSKELQQKLQELFSKDELPDVSGFTIPWITLYPGQINAPMFAFKDKILRLYNKHKGGMINEEYRNLDRPELTDGTKPGFINAPVYHRTILSFSHLEEKSTLYSQDQGRYNFNKGKKISNFKLFIEYPFKFLKYYIQRRNFVYGWYGFVISIIGAHRNFMRLAKTKELYAMQLEKELRNKK
jgi:glycosyltransferase involved in cell wall biosynthesis